MTSPTQRAGAKHVETLRAMRSVFRSIPSPCSERDALDAAIESQATIAALQARIAELEARNAASERRYRWMQQWFIEGRKRSEINPDGHITFTTPEMIDAAIDAHAQGQAGEEE